MSPKEQEEGLDVIRPSRPHKYTRRSKDKYRAQGKEAKYEREYA